MYEKEFLFLSEGVKEETEHKVVTTLSNCSHTSLIQENTFQICEECGMVMQKDIEYEKEWRYYGMTDSKHTSDPNRCHARRVDEKGIYKDVEKLGFSDKIITMANQIYQQVTQGKIFRGNSRKGIIFACVFHSYKMNQTPQSCEHLMEVFHIDRKIALKGLKFVNLNAPKDSEFRKYQIQTEHLIREIMMKFYAKESHVEEILQLYRKIHDKSMLLNRSRPKSVASGLVRYYILQRNANITMEYFRSRVQLSELTINRIVDEITLLLQPTS